MKVTIELPLERYDWLRNKCDESSPEFSVLMNGCIDRRPKGNDFERFIEIVCDKQQADALRSGDEILPRRHSRYPTSTTFCLQGPLEEHSVFTEVDDMAIDKGKALQPVQLVCKRSNYLWLRRSFRLLKEDKNRWKVK